MKKILIFAAAMCFMISAQAQTKMNELTENQLKSKIKTVEQLNRGTTAYTQKLDSVIMNYGPFNVGLIFGYDNLFNTTRVVLFGPGNPAITEYTYDNQNHRIGSIITHPNGDQDRTEYTYNSQGLVIKETQYELDNGEWEEDEQIIYEYDANGNLMVVTNYDYDILDWVYDEQTKYTYQNGKLTNELVYDWIIDEWVEDHSTDYLYNAQGDLVETIELDFDIDWIKDTRTEYTYDDNHNCLSQIVYDYDDDFGDWEIEGTLNLTYDLTVPSNVIAGIENFYNSLPSVNNKILTIEETQYNDGIPTVTIPYTLYYSEATGIGEHNGSQIAIWPNPASETLSLNAEGVQQVEIFTIDGRQVLHLENGFETINVSALAKGCYLLKATLNDGSKAVQKFVKE